MTQILESLTVMRSAIEFGQQFLNISFHNLLDDFLYQDWKPSDDNLPNWYPDSAFLSSWRKKLADVLRLNGQTFDAAIIDPYRDYGVAINAFRFSQKYKLWWCAKIYGDNHTKATPQYIFHSSRRPDRWSK